MTDPAFLSKAELLARVQRHVQRRGYETTVNAAWLDDLIKDGLAPPGVRVRNEGKRAVYRYDAKAYRRLLRIARLRGWGVRARASIRVMLFIAGYDEPSDELRPALSKVWASEGKSLLAQMRSGYIDNTRDVSNGHLQSLITQMGPLDLVISNAGFSLDPAACVEAFRTAVQSAPVPVAVQDMEAAALSFAGGLTNFDELAIQITPMLAGLLMFGGDQDLDPLATDHADGIIANSTDQQLVTARSILRMVDGPFVSSGIFGALKQTHDSAMRLDRGLRHSVRRTAFWGSQLLVLILLTIHRTGMPEGWEKAGSLIPQGRRSRPDSWLNSSRFSQVRCSNFAWGRLK